MVDMDAQLTPAQQVKAEEDKESFLTTAPMERQAFLKKMRSADLARMIQVMTKSKDRRRVMNAMAPDQKQQLMATMTPEQAAAFQKSLIPPPPPFCHPPSTDDMDAGFADEHRGWFDLQGCGQCNDYCRWIGGLASGGNPHRSTTDQTSGSYWSCKLAGSKSSTSKGHFKVWNKKKCTAQGAAPEFLFSESREAAPAAKAGEKAKKICMSKSDSRQDAGFTDNYRGWYDLQGCGECHDYCRWVGPDGAKSGGDPVKATSGKDGAYWSCRLAGSKKTYTPKNQFDQTGFKYKKCIAEGAAAPPAPVTKSLVGYKAREHETSLKESVEYDVLPLEPERSVGVLDSTKEFVVHPRAMAGMPMYNDV